MKIFSEITCIVCGHPCDVDIVVNNNRLSSLMEVDINCIHSDCKIIIDKLRFHEQQILNLEYDIFLLQLKKQPSNIYET